MTSYSLIPVFLMGLIGSAHCLTMCGPLVLATTRAPSDNYKYQIGRLVSYIVLATTLHFFGKTTLLLIGKNQIEFFASIIWAIILISIGIYQLTELNSKLSIIPQKLQLWINQRIRESILNKGPFFTCSLSIFLGCGFLYSAILSFLTFDSLMLIMIGAFSFWLGTLPSLISIGYIKKFATKYLKGKAQKLIPMLLILIGLISLYSRHEKIKDNWNLYLEQKASCH